VNGEIVVGGALVVVVFPFVNGTFLVSVYKLVDLWNLVDHGGMYSPLVDFYSCLTLLSVNRFGYEIVSRVQNGSTVRSISLGCIRLCAFSIMCLPTSLSFGDNFLPGAYTHVF
jgi:hypothetical protein